MRYTQDDDEEEEEGEEGEEEPKALAGESRVGAR